MFLISVEEGRHVAAEETSRRGSSEYYGPRFGVESYMGVEDVPFFKNVCRHAEKYVSSLSARCSGSSDVR